MNGISSNPATFAISISFDDCAVALFDLLVISGTLREGKGEKKVLCPTA